jgi:hypothetical protein
MLKVTEARNNGRISIGNNFYAEEWRGIKSWQKVNSFFYHHNIAMLIISLQLLILCRTTTIAMFTHHSYSCS